MKGSRRLSDALALILAGVPVLATAQATSATDNPSETTNPKELQEIVVTGMRLSMRDALAAKQEVTGVAEFITPADIGVLPDFTIAESLARLPGVNTVRDRGNDSQAGVRGLGPRMVLGLINGREMASSEPDRNVRWEVFPSEIVSGVRVYKSSQADLVAGGISATIDIQTIRPLDYSGPGLTLRAGPVYYDGGTSLPHQDSTGYRGSGAWVAKFTPTLGFVVSGAVQKQNNGYESVGGGGWNYFAPGAVDPGGPLVENPWGATIDEKAIETTRASVSMSLQWMPSEVFEGRIDLLGSTVKLNEWDDGGWYTAWGNWDGGNTGTPENPGFTNNVVKQESLVATDMTFDSYYNPYVSRYKQDSSLYATGVNGKWTFDRWTAVADASYSEAERAGVWQAAIMYNWMGPMSYDYTGTLPKLWAQTNAYDVALAGGLFPTYGEADVSRLRDRMTTANIDLTRTINSDHWNAFKFGARYSDRSKDDAEPYRAVQVSPLDWAAPVDPNLVKPWDYKAFTVPTMISGNYTDMVTALYGADAVELLNPDYKNTPFVSEVTEEVFEGYAMAEYLGQIGGVPLDGNFGVRFVNVDQTSQGPSNGVDIKVSDSYSEVLPSLNGRLDFGDGVYVKFGLSRALSRPPLNDLRVDRAFSTIPPYTGGGGNPNLKPYLADQLDLSYENYFHEDALFAVAAYAKRIKNYIGFETRTVTIPDFDQPVAFTSPYNQKGTGNLYGVEFTFQTPFYFIPHLENFGIYSNLALADSDIEESSPPDDPVSMNGVAKTTAIVDLWYTNARFDARLGFKYHSAYTVLFTWASGNLQTLRSETTLDFSSGYRINDNFSLRFQAGNLLNTPLRLYDNNNSSQIARNDVYGRHYLVDLTLKF